MAVDELEIEGFKPLKSLKFDEGDLGMVNVITGRNNTGKSSILEAMDLLYSPTHLEDFSKHAGDLINKDMGECRISDNDTQLAMRLADEDEYTNYYNKTISWFFSNIYLRDSTHEDSTVDSLSEFIHRELEDSEPQISESVRRELSKEDILVMRDHILIIRVDNNYYPYRYFSAEDFSELTASITDSITDILEQNTDLREIEFLYAPSTPNQGFLIEEPPNTGVAKLVKTPVTDVTDYEPESEKDALKIDDIEDEITERGIVDNLKDFDLDYLVFEEDGEKDSVPFDFMGDGFKSMVGILWELVEDDESEIVMIEEPENHMHPGYVREMLDFLVTMAREDEIQLFITTHSIDLLNYLFTENLPDEHRKFLKDELSVIRMESPELVEVLDYEEANRKSEELHLDLRGI